VPNPTAYVIWCAIHGLFLDNADQHAAYALQEFHSLFQGELSINDYFTRLKHLTNLLRDVGHPMSDPAMVINTLRGLNSKFSHAISVITTRKSLPSFLFMRDYLLQEEDMQQHTVKMEAASALVIGTSSALPLRPPAPSSALTLPPVTSPNESGGQNNNKKKRKANNNKKLSGLSSDLSAPPPPWSTTHKPWTGLV
jgi:hypothetical protein